MALYRLANQFGVTAARRLLLFSEDMTAAQAERFGVLDQIADNPGEELHSRLTALRARTGDELAIRRRLLLDATTVSFEEALGPHLAACDRSLRRAHGSETSTLAALPGQRDTPDGRGTP
jgi:isomerase DpgB